MGHFVKINSNNVKKYELVGGVGFKNFLTFAKHLKFQKLTHIGSDDVTETYYDTPNHLLNKSGVVLSRFQEGSTVFFKVENASFMSKVLNKMQKQVFIHEVGSNDKLADHAFYVKDGITSLFSTAFSVDLENVIKTAEPKMEVVINAEIYQLISGTGMRAKIALEKKYIKNFETKRKYQVESMTIKLENENLALFGDDFEHINNLIQKNCKELILVDENQFDFASKVTRAIEPKPKQPKEAKQKPKLN